MSALKAISSFSFHSRHNVSHTQTVSVDIPCSQQIFVEKFVNPVESITYSGEDSFKCTVAASDLDVVFGPNWNTYRFRNSKTRKRIFGLLVIHYRKKKLLLSDSTFR